MEFNENYRYETRLKEEKKQFSLCICFKGSVVNKENDAGIYERKLEINKLFNLTSKTFVPIQYLKTALSTLLREKVIFKGM